MLYALSPNNQKITATPKALATCPQCEQPLTAKCGSIKAWHWAHKTQDCDSWYEPESEWHLAWKQLVEPESTEVVIGNHRADIVTNDGLVIELQNSSISVEKIKEREQFYNNMIWVFNAQSFAHRLEACGNYRHKLIDVINFNMNLEETEEEQKLNSASFRTSTPWNKDLNALKLISKPKRQDITTPIGSMKCLSVYLDPVKWSYLKPSHRSITKPLFYDLGNNLIFYVTHFPSYWNELKGWFFLKQYLIMLCLSEIILF